VAALVQLRSRAAAVIADGMGGDAANLEKAQRALQHRARMNGHAGSGEYVSEMEQSTTVGRE
jgi:hypothetical protein